MLRSLEKVQLERTAYEVNATAGGCGRWRQGLEPGEYPPPATLCYCVQPKDHKKETDHYEIVSDAMRNNKHLAHWRELPWDRRGGHTCNLLWSWANPHCPNKRVDAAKLLRWQKVNRFPDSKPLTRKDFLKRNLQRYSQLPGDLGAAFNCFPETFNLPQDYKTFLAEFNRVSRRTHTSASMPSPSPTGGIPVCHRCMVGLSGSSQ